MEVTASILLAAKCMYKNSMVDLVTGPLTFLTRV